MYCSQGETSVSLSPNCSAYKIALLEFSNVKEKSKGNVYSSH